MKVVVIGLDGATWDLVKPWAKNGKLPTIARLMDEGSAGELRSTIPPITAPAWTSFMTGKNPGKHGLYDWIYQHADSYNVSPVTAKHIQEPALWDILGDSGLRVCMLNIPMSFPPKPVNGIMVAGLPAPSTKVNLTSPPSLMAEIERENGPYLLYPDPGQAYSDSGVDSFLNRLYATTENRFRVIRSLRSREEWDFFMMVFNGTDTVQHATWKYMDESHPLHDPKKSTKYGNSILDYFKYVDKHLEEIVNSLDKDTVLILMSDHGFGPFHKFIHVNNWLRKHNWLLIKKDLKSRIKLGLFSLGLSPMSVYDALMRLGFGSLKREVVRGKGQGLLKTLFLSFDEVDWKKTQAYSLGNVGQIRLNVKGREPIGAVDPKDYSEVRETIIQELRLLEDPATGERVVDEIYRREEIYNGPSLEQAADILFIPKRLEYFGFGEYEFGSHKTIEAMKRGISGTHRMNGMFLIWGPNINENRWLEGANLIDLAPTILHLLDQPVPNDMDGIVLLKALSDDLQDVRRTDRSLIQDPTQKDNDEDELSEEEKELILKRMRDLGYAS